jgi:hypothetical protein
MIEIQAFYERLHKAAAGFVAKGEEQIPLIALMMPSGDVELIAMPDASKDQVAELQRHAASQGCVAVLIWEAWQANYDKMTPQQIEDHKAGLLSLEDVEGRTEAVLFNILTPTRQGLAMCPIDRSTNSLALAPINWFGEDNGMKFSGRFVRENTPQSN